MTETKKRIADITLEEAEQWMKDHGYEPGPSAGKILLDIAFLVFCLYMASRGLYWIEVEEDGKIKWSESIIGIAWIIGWLAPIWIYVSKTMEHGFSYNIFYGPL